MSNIFDKAVSRRTVVTSGAATAVGLGITYMFWQDKLELLGLRSTSGALDLRHGAEVITVNRKVEDKQYVNEPQTLETLDGFLIVPGDVISRKQKFGVQLKGTNLVGKLMWATEDGGEATEGALWEGTPAVAHEGAENVLDDNQTGTSDKGVKHQVIVRGPGGAVLYDSAAGGEPTRLVPTSEGVVEAWTDSDDDYQFEVEYLMTFDPETPHQVRMNAEGEFKAALIDLKQADA